MNKIAIFLSVIFIVLMQSSCSEKNDMLTVGTHPQGWNDQSSEKFHGRAVLEGGKEQCATCHGQNFQGGTSKLACYGSGCHLYYPHPAGFAELSSASFHGEVIKSQLKWDIMDCQRCHGADYAGGSSGVTCRDCHTGPDGPEECNTCHGNELNIAPPQDLSNNVSRDSLGVGAHQIHVATTMITRVYLCTACHVAVNNVDDPIHIDTTPGTEFAFSALATDNGRLTPVWNRTNGSCSQVYCHGSFRFGSVGNPITGNADPVVWTAQNPDPAACNFCHALPPTGHIGQGQYTTPGSCATCHGSVVTTSGMIINKSLHINGQPNFN